MAISLGSWKSPLWTVHPESIPIPTLWGEKHLSTASCCLQYSSNGISHNYTGAKYSNGLSHNYTGAKKEKTKIVFQKGLSWPFFSTYPNAKKTKIHYADDILVGFSPEPPPAASL